MFLLFVIAFINIDEAFYVLLLYHSSSNMNNLYDYIITRMTIGLIVHHIGRRLYSSLRWNSDVGWLPIDKGGIWPTFNPLAAIVGRRFVFIGHGIGSVSNSHKENDNDFCNGYCLSLDHNTYTLSAHSNCQENIDHCTLLDYLLVRIIGGAVLSQSLTTCGLSNFWFSWFYAAAPNKIALRHFFV